jgi:DNA-binding NtrC family response regulator
MLKQYLPEDKVEKLPAVFKGDKDQNRTFSNEREILYQVLFDMRKEINELKELFHGIVRGTMPQNVSDEFYPAEDPRLNQPVPQVVVNHPEKHDIMDADVFEEEENKSLEDVEKEMILKALERNGGRRKNAARDLKISERTLYRKIKEYKLEE